MNDLTPHLEILVRRNLIFRDKNFVFGHSYRGGSSLITRILFACYNIDTQGLHSEKYRDEIYNPMLLKDVTSEEMLSIIKSREFTRIKFVRCPYRRAVSSYLYCMGKEMEGDTARIRPLRTTDPRLQGREAPIYISFRQFLIYLSKINLEAYSCDNHFAKQFLYFENKLMHYDYICKIENLSTELPLINTHFSLGVEANLDDEMNKLSAHHLQFRNDINEYVDEWVYPKLIHLPETGQMQFPHYKYFYSPKTKAMVDKLYSDDLANYKYSFRPNKW